MKILLVHGHRKQMVSDDILYALKKLGYEAEEYQEVWATTVLDDNQIGELVSYIKENEIDFLISVYFVMNAAMAAYKADIRYISIIWDAPYVGIYNPLGRIDNVWISTFDRLERDRYLSKGIRHVLYQPLSINRDLVEQWGRDVQETLKGSYIHDISFVGRLYDNNAYDDRVEMIPEVMRQYFNSIFDEAAFKWDGVNRVYGTTSDEIWKYIQLVSPKFKMVNRMDIEDARCFEMTCLVKKIANIERVAVLNVLAEEYSVAMYTDSKSAGTVLKNVELHLPVAPGKAAGRIYAGSKINLNISLKGMEGGTPLRIMDIMAAGGFVLSSYCVETAELFEEDREIVMFRTPEELKDKVDYYLSHDMERKRIAEAGYKKVLACYTYENKLKQLMEWIEGESGRIDVNRINK
ncbi:MAG: glycosyltransferase [Lachnospiraceae bacterium]|nr:glycosyltransferase [Lachnospiraceae bacterium]